MLVICVNNRWYYVSVACSWMAFALPTLFSVHFAKSIDMDMDAYGKCVALTYGISLGLALPVGALADRVHPLRLGLVAMGLFAVVAGWSGTSIATSSWAAQSWR